jgi:hypothetical protein
MRRAGENAAKEEEEEAEEEQREQREQKEREAEVVLDARECLPAICVGRRVTECCRCRSSGVLQNESACVRACMHVCMAVNALNERTRRQYSVCV